MQVRIPVTYKKNLSGFNNNEITPNKYNNININLKNSAENDLLPKINHLINSKQFSNILFKSMSAKNKISTRHEHRGHKHFEIYTIDPEVSEVTAILATLLLNDNIDKSTIQRLIDINYTTAQNIDWLLDYRDSNNKPLDDYIEYLNNKTGSKNTLYNQDIKTTEKNTDKISTDLKTDSNTNLDVKDHVVPSKPAVNLNIKNNNYNNNNKIGANMSTSNYNKESSYSTPTSTSATAPTACSSEAHRNGEPVFNKYYAVKTMGTVNDNEFASTDTQGKNMQTLIDFMNANIAYGSLPVNNTWLAVAGFKLGRSEVKPSVSYDKYQVVMNTNHTGQQLLEVLDQYNGGNKLTGSEADAGIRLLANLVNEFKRQQSAVLN